MFTDYLIAVFPLVAVVSALACLPVWLYHRVRRQPRPFLRYVTLFAFTGCCLSLLYLTILWYYPYISFHPDYYFWNLIPFVWIRETYSMGAGKMAVQLLLNIAMFVPYGLLLPMVFARLRRALPALLTVLATTCTIEILQFFLGRSADIDDVIMNFLGGALGFLLFCGANRLLQNRRWWNSLLAN